MDDLGDDKEGWIGVVGALDGPWQRKEIEVYMDDMITKSRTEEEHLVNLWKLFKRLRKY